MNNFSDKSDSSGSNSQFAAWTILSQRIQECHSFLDLAASARLRPWVHQEEAIKKYEALHDSMIKSSSLFSIGLPGQNFQQMKPPVECDIRLAPRLQQALYG